MSTTSTEALQNSFIEGRISREDYVNKLAILHGPPPPEARTTHVPGAFITSTEADGTVSLRLAKEGEDASTPEAVARERVAEAVAELRELTECECPGQSPKVHRNRCLSGYAVDVETVATALGLTR